MFVLRSVLERVVGLDVRSIFTPPPMSLMRAAARVGLAFLNRLGEAGLKRRHVLLEAGRVDVRQIVGDDFQPLGLNLGALGRDVHSVRHRRETIVQVAPLHRRDARPMHAACQASHSTRLHPLAA